MSIYVLGLNMFAAKLRSQIIVFIIYYSSEVECCETLFTLELFAS